MAVPTVRQMSAAIQRRCRGRIPLLMILDALEEKHKEIHGVYEWPWTKAETNLAIQPTYSTGTVSIVDQSTALTGNGATWDANWNYKRIYLGSQNVDRLIESFDVPLGGDSAATLVQPINLGYDVVAQPYTIFQDIYALPEDCETILLIVNPLYRYRLQYIATYTLQWQNVFSRVFFSNFQTGFCDGAYDDATKRSTIQLAPAPSAIGEYRLVYRRKPPALSTMASQPIVPETYYRAVELLAEYQVRFENGLPGWSECKKEGYQIVMAMRRKYTAAPMYDTYSAYWQYPYYTDSSVYASGLFVGPTVA